MQETTAERASMKVLPETWQALNALKQPGDTFDDVIKRLLVRPELKTALEALRAGRSHIREHASSETWRQYEAAIEALEIKANLS